MALKSPLAEGGKAAGWAKLKRTPTLDAGFLSRTQRYPTETESASPILTQPTSNPKTQQHGGSPLG